MIALLSGVLAVILFLFRREGAEIICRLWISYKRWTGYDPRRFDGPRIQSTVISSKEWEEVA